MREIRCGSLGESENYYSYVWGYIAVLQYFKKFFGGAFRIFLFSKSHILRFPKKCRSNRIVVLNMSHRHTHLIGIYLRHWQLAHSVPSVFHHTRLRVENNGERLFTEEPPGATRYSQGENSARLYVSDNIFWLQPGGKHNGDCTVEKWFIFLHQGMWD